MSPRPPTWWWNGPSGRFANSKALTRLDAMARLEGTGETIGLQLVTRTLGAAAAAPTGSTGRCCQCGMRGPEHSPPRTSWQQPAPTHHLGSRVSAYLLRDLTTLSWPEIAHQLGRERHSTVHGAAKRITKALELDESTHSLPEQGEVPMRLLIDRVRRSALQAERR